MLENRDQYDYESDSSDQPEPECKKRKAPSAEEVERNIEAGIWELKSNSRSNYSLFLRCIYDVATKNYLQLVQCVKCKRVFSSLSTKSIKEHMINDHKVEPSNDVDTLLNIFLKFLIGDLRPFNIINTENFKEFFENAVKTVISILEKNPTIPIRQLIPSGQKISRALDTKYEEMFQHNVFPLIDVANQCGFAITADFAQNTYTYLAITLHVIDRDWKLNNIVLKCALIPSDKSKTEKYVVETVTNQLSDCGLSGSSYYVVTDEGPGMLGFTKQVRCCCHMLSTITKHITTLYADTKLSSDDQNNCKLVLDSITELQSFIGSARLKIDIRERLGNSLVMPVATRFISKYFMVHSYLESAEKIGEVLRESFPELYTIHNRLMTEKRVHLEAYIRVVNPISISIKTLEGETYPTAPMILPSFAKLWALFSDLVHFNCVYTKSLAKSALEALEKKMKVLNNKASFIAAYLEPKIRIQLKAMCSAVPKYSYDEIVEVLKEEASKYGGAEVTESNNNAQTFTFFEPEITTRSIDTELVQYEALSLSGTNSLEFWKLHENVFPILSRMAKEYLCIPASSAPSERAFSKLNLVSTEVRNRLDPETICQLVGLQSLIKQTDFLEM